MHRHLPWATALVLLALSLPARAGLMPPPLATSDYAELRSEMLQRIPTYAPGWTNHAGSDPGVTLLELFAFVVEGLSAKVFEDGLIDPRLWLDFDAQDDATMGAIAYTLLDAAYLARYKEDLRGDDWLLVQGIDPQWTYAQLREASILAVPEPGTLGLLVAGLLVLGMRRWHSSRVAPPSPGRRSAITVTREI